MIFNVAQSPINWQLLIFHARLKYPLGCSEDHYLRYDSRLCTAERAPFMFGPRLIGFGSRTQGRARCESKLGIGCLSRALESELPRLAGASNATEWRQFRRRGHAAFLF